MATYQTVVLYEKFCTRCGEPGHTQDVCLNFKTTICSFWKRKKCRNNDCPYAHGPWELRRPKNSHCVKVFEVAPRTYVVRGCGEKNSHSFENCNRQGLLLPSVPVTYPRPPPPVELVEDAAAAIGATAAAAFESVADASAASAASVQPNFIRGPPTWAERVTRSQ